jgi:hypothetical protein
MSPAGYWWARLSSSLLVRLFYYILSPVGDDDALLFADDIMMIAARMQDIIDMGAMLLIWCALGTPWKWRKFRGGNSCSWIGYWMDWQEFRLGLSVSRAAWIAGC